MWRPLPCVKTSGHHGSDGSLVHVRNYFVYVYGGGRVLRQCMMNVLGIRLFIWIRCWKLWWLLGRRRKHWRSRLVGNRVWLFIVEIYKGSGSVWSLWLGILVIGSGRKDLA